jgi:hypothetical protein
MLISRFISVVNDTKYLEKSERFVIYLYNIANRHLRKRGNRQQREEIDDFSLKIDFIFDFWRYLIYSDITPIQIYSLKTPRVGFEPTTNRLTADRSTTELPRIALYIKL